MPHSVTVCQCYFIFPVLLVFRVILFFLFLNFRVRQFTSLYGALMPIDEKICEDADIIDSMYDETNRLYKIFVFINLVMFYYVFSALFCIVWSVGGSLTTAGREKFDLFIKRICNRSTSANGAGRDQVPADSLYDNFFDLKTV